MLSTVSIFLLQILMLVNNLSKVCCTFSKKKVILFNVIKVKTSMVYSM